MKRLIKAYTMPEYWWKRLFILFLVSNIPLRLIAQNLPDVYQLVQEVEKASITNMLPENHLKHLLTPKQYSHLSETDTTRYTIQYLDHDSMSNDNRVFLDWNTTNVDYTDGYIDKIITQESYYHDAITNSRFFILTKTRYNYRKDYNYLLAIEQKEQTMYDITNNDSSTLRTDYFTTRYYYSNQDSLLYLKEYYDGPNFSPTEIATKYTYQMFNKMFWVKSEIVEHKHPMSSLQSLSQYQVNYDISQDTMHQVIIRKTTNSRVYDITSINPLIINYDTTMPRMTKQYDTLFEVYLHTGKVYEYTWRKPAEKPIYSHNYSPFTVHHGPPSFEKEDFKKILYYGSNGFSYHRHLNGMEMTISKPNNKPAAKSIIIVNVYNRPYDTTTLRYDYKVQGNKISITLLAPVSDIKPSLYGVEFYKKRNITYSKTVIFTP